MSHRLQVPAGVFVAALLFASTPDVARAVGPIITPNYGSNLSIGASVMGAGAVTQMAWGPDGRLYASRYVGGAVSFRYDASTGLLDDMKSVSDVSGLGIAFAPDRGEMYLSSMDSIWRLTNAGGSDAWGEGPGDVKVKIVGDIPTGNHAVNQLQIQGNSLYVGIGTRTFNGGTGNDNAPPWDPADNAGESAYNGTVSWIRDLGQAANATDSARVMSGSDVNAIQNDGSPYATTDAGKLVVHSAGLRNPYGLALDAQGSLFLTNNYQRALTNGDGTVTDMPQDGQVPDFDRAVHDQFFRAQLAADYGYRNDNWRGVRDPAVKADVLDPTNPDHLPVRSITPDNLHASDPNYLWAYAPDNPVGLGPSSSANGLDFWYAQGLPDELRGNAFISRFTESVSEAPPGGGQLVYQDLVAVDPNTGQVRRIATGFVNPLAVLSDGQGRLLVADFGAGGIYSLSAVPEPSPLTLIAAAGLVAAGWGWARRRLGSR